MPFPMRVRKWCCTGQIKTSITPRAAKNFPTMASSWMMAARVRFRLVAADTAKDNRKDNDKERRFVLIEPHTRILADDDGEEYEEELLPVEEVES